ncbi:MAG: ribosome assembly RNA-binding protein YhbY [Dokdonella sp.]|jgi:RNA-binding protein|nr:ribosome assembly RNA-binding protein YhbY [Dokdonella sp.]
MSLNPNQKRHLRGLAHALHPLIQIGQRGITDPLLAELGQALDHHELVKVRLAGDRDERQAQTAALIEATGAELVQAIGGIACLFRRNREQPVIDLPR